METLAKQKKYPELKTCHITYTPGAKYNIQNIHISVHKDMLNALEFYEKQLIKEHGSKFNATEELIRVIEQTWEDISTHFYKNYAEKCLRIKNFIPFTESIVVMCPLEYRAKVRWVSGLKSSIIEILKLSNIVFDSYDFINLQSVKTDNLEEVFRVSKTRTRYITRPSPASVSETVEKEQLWKLMYIAKTFK